MATTYTVIRNGTLLSRGTWAQVEQILSFGYVVTRRHQTNDKDHIVLTVGLLIK